ncbi:MAG: tRNA-dihydrouridine synthase [Armatimonadetes bacterium]|nr:tRNA-dihydrouridine synthase [Armatimonadota bacterium]
MTVPALRLGGLRISPPIGLAPMAGFTTLPMRLMARRAGAGFVYTEMVPAEALVRGCPIVRRRLAISPREHPVIVQLYGADPSVLADAAAIAEDAGADVVDLNLGCVAPEALRCGAGAALAAQPVAAAACVAAIASATRRPVTAKLRAGTSPANRSYLDLAKRLVNAGASAVALHARTVAQGFRGRADWRLIADLVEAVQVPVLGNGDVRSADDALAMLATTGCAGVLVGRAAIGNPWLFGGITARLQGCSMPAAPSPGERLAAALWLIGMLSSGPLAYDLPALQRQVLPLLREMPGIKKLREAVAAARCVEEMRQAVMTYWASVRQEAGA